MQVHCNHCGRETRYDIVNWRCECGGAWEPASIPSFNPGKIFHDDYSIWRYGALIGLDIQRPAKPMGVGWTPLVPVQLEKQKVFLKLEFLSPSGSFKDRGVNAMIEQLFFMGVNAVAEDSSGNAGASLAAHAAHFGIKADIYVPASASEEKKYQIGIYGANVIPIPGPRKAAEIAAQNSVSPHHAYASHAYNPAYLAGQVTAAYELWEQLGHQAPDWIICPVAQGGQFLGYWFGFKNLLKAGLITKLPRLVAVQSAMVAPIFAAWEEGLNHIPEIVPSGKTIAEGVSIANPVRDLRLLQALRETDGQVLKMAEEEIIHGQEIMNQQGFFIEPTSALVVSGFRKLVDKIEENEIAILPLTGTGLKSVSKITRN
jgi:threonine synthase